MTHRLLHGAAAAAAAATLIGSSTMAPGVMAQAPSPQADSRHVTAIGCLEQQRDVFVLVNPRIAEATAPAPTDATANSRSKTAPSGAPGAAGSGTSGTGSTSSQSSERPPSDAARPPTGAGTPGGAQGSSAKTMYKVTGLPDDQLRPNVHRRVEVRGTLDAAAMGGAAVRQPGSTMGSEPASTPSASTPPPASPPGQGQAPSTKADKPSEMPLPELRATAIRAMAGSCRGT